MFRWRVCESDTREVRVKKQATAPLTATRVVREAKEMATKVEPGIILGAECASEQEPFIVMKATSELYQWSGDDEYTWMGWVRAGDWIIVAIKFEKYGGSDVFWLRTEKRFPVFQEDLRSIITKCHPIAVRQSQRVQSAPTQRIEVEAGEISNLQERVMMDTNNVLCKPRGRPRAHRA